MSTINDIKQERDRRMAGGVLVNGVWWQTDQFSRIQLMQAVVADLPPVEWSAMGGEPGVLLDVGTARTVIRATLAKDVAIHAAAQRHIAALNTSGNPSNYNFTRGWPQAFGE